MGLRAVSGSFNDLPKKIKDRLRRMENPAKTVENAAWSELEKQYAAARIPRVSGDSQDSLKSRSHTLNKHWINRNGLIVWATTARGAVFNPELIPKVKRDALAAALKKALGRVWARGRR